MILIDDLTCGALPPQTFSHEALTRPLALLDLPALLELEAEKWTAEQAASDDDLAARITDPREIALGAFCARSGRLLASLFLRPVADDFHRHAATWRDCTRLATPGRSRTLFGVSLSSRDKRGVDALWRDFWPVALRQGWRHIYLGSPVPGLRAWLHRHPAGRPEDYVFDRAGGLPRDPQLRYYHRRGFRDIVALKPGYFPHAGSLDHGVLLRATVPLSSLAPLWRALPEAAVRSATRRLASSLA
ncbi:MAG TPA: hypothetical protein VF457_12720 [Burkholderiaceae bacterium]